MRKCPNCDTEMKIVDAEEIELDECPKCGGIWVDNSEEKQALEMKPEVFTMDELRRLRKSYKAEEKIEEVKYRKCPICGDMMWRKNYMSFSGIVVDKCDKHGIYFDKGELEKAAEYVAKGGAEYEKMKTAETDTSYVERKVSGEIRRVERTMFRLHWLGRFLSIIGF